MKVSTTMIRNAWEIACPTLKFIWLFDKYYWAMPENKLNSLASEFKDFGQWTEQIGDCDNWALAWYDFLGNYRVRHKDQIPEAEWFQYAAGRVCGTMFRGMPMNHAIGWALTEEGLRLIDRGPRIWTPAPENDSIYFLEA